jgi:heavy metal translocating P-type ATPase
VEAVEKAERSRAPVQKTADRLAGYLVYFAMGAATLTFLITGDVRSTIAVVIVAGACGIAAGTPLAILGAIGQTARQGSIVKGGLYLELLARVERVVLDKTGTLTYGMPAVSAVLPAEGATEAEVLAAAAGAEGPSEHPLGSAILRHAQERAVPLREAERFQYTPGRGIVAALDGEEVVAGNRALLEELGFDGSVPPSREAGASEVLVARGGRYLGTIEVTDLIRPQAKEAIAALREMGIRTLLLSGDRAEVADAVARELGMDGAEGDLLPEIKQRRVEELVASGTTVAMVGDGINDGPALAAAHVGVAMGSGTDVARESADVVLIGNDLSKFVETLRIARRTRRVILQNFVGTIAVDAAGVGLAAFGMLSPLFAAFIHVASELAFLLNSARLLPAISKE